MKIAAGLKVVSFFPGRVRLRVDELKGNRILASNVEARLAEVPGIVSVEANAASASMLVKYDRREIVRPGSIQALEKTLRALFPRVDFSRLQQQLTRN